MKQIGYNEEHLLDDVVSDVEDYLVIILFVFIKEQLINPLKWHFLSHRQSFRLSYLTPYLTCTLRQPQS